MPVEWKDTTSYRQGGDRIPTCWTAKFGDMSVTVLTGHIYHAGKWVMHFRPLYDAHPIGDAADMTERQAKTEAVRLAREKLAPTLNALDSAVAVI